MCYKRLACPTFCPTLTNGNSNIESSEGHGLYAFGMISNVAGSLPEVRRRFRADSRGRFDGSDLDPFCETVVDLGEFQMRSSVERPGVKR